ncbi:MAG: hypothetical protein IJ362_08925 [Oscillospiraceae bacterium]|nr:hypothetical protein [Oscillospiraceae bacterium]
MKKLIALVLSAVMALSLVACGGSNSDETTELLPVQPETVKILAQSTREAEVNIMRDQLEHAGFVVEVDMQPDYSSVSAARDKGDYDLCISGWSTGTGNLDYAVRGILHSTGDYNYSPVIDEEVDRLIDLGASQTQAQAVETYLALETRIIDEMAYMIPLYSPKSVAAFNKNVIDVDNLKVYKSSGPLWWEYRYKDASQNETRPIVFTQQNAVMSTLDPVQGNDASMGTACGANYAKLISLDVDDSFRLEGTASYSYAIAEGNSEFYFLLRDDIYFGAVKDGEVYNTGVRAGGEDVVYSLERASNKDSVPSHKTFTLHNHLAKIEVLTDLGELSAKLDSDTGATVLETLQKGIDGEIGTLVAKDEDADNAAGKYQVVKITTTEAFPQVLNFLCHNSAGIVCKEQVEKYNAKFMKDGKFDVSNYDISKDVCYGDFAAFKNGDTEMLWCSGPFVMTKVDDYGATFVMNPGFKAGEEDRPTIKTYYLKFIMDQTAATSAFRAGEIDALTSVNANDVATLQADENFDVRIKDANSTYYCYVNMREGSKFNNLDLRKAVLYAINQNDFIAYKDGMVNPVYSVVDTFLHGGDNGPRVLEQDLVKSNAHLAAYQATLAE